MSSAEILWDDQFLLTEKFKVEARVYKVKASTKFPDGIKARFVLIDLDRNCARLLVDNHAPYSFHMHPGLPEDKETRIPLKAKDFSGAYDEFLKAAERIIKNEE